ncbi:MAG: hypothetical protein ACI33I_09885 [Clostridium sp.]
MSKIQEMLEESIKLWGPSDIVTIMLSQRKDKEVVEEQKMIYEAYKEANNVFTICN